MPHEVPASSTFCWKIQKNEGSEYRCLRHIEYTSNRGLTKRCASPATPYRAVLRDPPTAFRLPYQARFHRKNCGFVWFCYVAVSSPHRNARIARAQRDVLPVEEGAAARVSRGTGPRADRRGHIHRGTSGR